MPRPRKCRKICRLPKVSEFRPLGGRKGSVTLTVDEYEAVRLIDREGFSQEECAGYMQVARTTVQQIYNTARMKIAEALVEGLGIRIDGGDYRICDGTEKQCGCGGCKKHRMERCKNGK